MHLVIEPRADRRCKNLPTGNELAVIIPNEFGEQSRQDIVLAVCKHACNCLQLERIDVTHATYMPLHYVISIPLQEQELVLGGMQPVLLYLQDLHIVPVQPEPLPTMTPLCQHHCCCPPQWLPISLSSRIALTTLAQ